ncbi:bifunctional tetrahydrofolate synthase/dihydrofolate synthase [Nitrosomonas sp. Nm58]|uniref:bifunctional tetrahydrofolate synthase/dihydrofolate synthase n=1 Tax=Nitrosomonas sp. Nm58 TaxID=200126 RepID=UPI0008957F34|nr:bifunctional tetrahydrofolate synthase/dihydrofolate synthase [Nitrosomonas sp. Nm58]SDY49201.1 dihydrofolate synthase / folylpolyglutamate synthase [Nitrosomonas sp. Nm58]
MAEKTAKLTSLTDWLLYLEHLHPKVIDMGLVRVRQVKDTVGLIPTFPLIAVGGTNGKGSTCAMLESILSCAGYRVGCYTSPHLLKYNERVRIEQKAVSDEELCYAFDVIESARLRCDTSLTYFEFGTLAAMHLFTQSKVDVAILEVGLGGRLDAVNVFDADCAILTNIDLDHMDYLGSTREEIGIEKIGIFRKNKIAICGEPNLPEVVRKQINAIDAKFFCIGDDFNYKVDKIQWDYKGPVGGYSSLPHPALRGIYQLKNASICLTALSVLRDKLPVTASDVRRGLLEISLPGRFQVLPGKPATILDVAHNPAAARVLADNLGALGFHQYTYGVIGMLKDKDIASVVQALKKYVDTWLVASTDIARGASSDEIIQALKKIGITNEDKIRAFPNAMTAYVFAREHATENDRICVFGSFYTVSAVLAVL